MGEFERTVIDGKPYVLVPQEEFEDMLDVIEARQILARVAEGEETWPAVLAQELLETKSRIRTFRKYRGLTINQLAAAIGISQPYLSDIERGRRAGSIDVLKRLAVALDVDLDDLVD